MDLWHQLVLFFSDLWFPTAHFFMHLWVWIKHYIEMHPDQVLWIAVIVAFLEALPVIGTIFPGSVSMTLVGIFVGRGLVSISEAVLWTTIGAFMGDCVGYLFGRAFSERIPRHWPFKKHPHWLENGRKFFKKHGIKSIILGRFIGPARSTIPLISGVFGMKWNRFCVAAIFSAFFWAAAYLFPGILIGAVSLEMTPAQTTLFLLFGLCVIVCLWFIFWLIQRFFSGLARACNRLFIHLWNKWQHSRFVSWIAIPEDPSNASPFKRLAWFLVAAIIFIVLWVCVLNQTGLAALNWPAFKLIQSLRNQGLDSFFSVVTLMGSPKAMIILMGVMAIWYGVQRDWKTLFFWFLGLCLVGGAVFVFKIIVPEPRPLGFNYVAATHGFPSGHTALSTIAFGLLAYWTTLKLEPSWRSIWRGMTLVLLFLIAISRLYLGAHWLWDVISGFALAGSVWLLVTMLYRRSNASSQVRFQSSSTWLTLCVVVVTSGFFVYKNYAKELYRTTPIWEKRTESIASWLQSPHQGIPQFLENRVGRAYLPMNIQWLGNPVCIRNQLEKLGWHPANSSWDIGRLVQRFALKKAEDQLPILKKRFQGRVPDIVFVKSVGHGKKILELYLWTSGVFISQVNSHVLVGFVNQINRKERYKKIKAIKKIQYQSGTIAQEFVKDLGTRYEVKKITLSEEIGATYKKQGWLGDTWLIYPSHRFQESGEVCP